jgi:hypothetical protein
MPPIPQKALKLSHKVDECKPLVTGVEENCMFFKEIKDASKFRQEVNERFERATLPGIPRERIKVGRCRLTG